jgi:hypothetical protein
MKAQVFHVSPIAIPVELGVRREPPRPGARNDAKYMSEFDERTIYYDVFRRGPDVVAVGPPQRNLRKFVSQCFRDGQGKTARGKVRKMDRVDRTIYTKVPTDFVASGNHPVRVSNDERSFFAGKRVLLTMSKDNNLDWIKDWVTYYVANHRTDSVLIFDNSSLSYQAVDIVSALADVPGLDAVGVVEWPFKYGPQGGGAARAPWDSDYSQSGMFEVAFRRFLLLARSVVNVDVDELILPIEGGVHQCVETSSADSLAFQGRWVSAQRRSGRIMSAFAPYVMVETASATCPPKWVVVPGRLRPRSQLTVHKVRGGRNAQHLGLEYRHFRAINTHWKYKRDTGSDAIDARVDERLVDGIERAVEFAN